jgi:ribosomal protein L11 methyltransferase
MTYIQLHIPTTSQDIKDTLIALLSDLDVIGVEEKDAGIEAYWETTAFDSLAVQNLLQPMQLTYTTTTLEKTNWNATWEENFQPVIIDDFCSVRAHFHPKPNNVAYDIVITPKMSFGTGHHATTALMMTFMRNMHWEHKTVFDFGTGTGILAILADKLGAAVIVAVDNDEWSYENAIENVQNNDCSKVNIELFQEEVLPDTRTYDVILANINRHILLAYMQQMYTLLNTSGDLLLSGILPEDIEVVQSAAETAGFIYKHHAIQNNWVAMHFSKN